MESRNNSKKTNRSLRLEEDSGEAEIIQLLEKNEGNPVEIVGRKEPSNKNEFRTVLSQVSEYQLTN